jgi:hypothetical protein
MKKTHACILSSSGICDETQQYPCLPMFAKLYELWLATNEGSLIFILLTLRIRREIHQPGMCQENNVYSCEHYCK